MECHSENLGVNQNIFAVPEKLQFSCVAISVVNGTRSSTRFTDNATFPPGVEDYTRTARRPSFVKGKEDEASTLEIFTLETMNAEAKCGLR